jgi:RimJ/RimL family protein N-acetyltransferase
MIFARSERLLLRRSRPEDVAAMLPGWSDPDMVRYTGIKADPEGFLRQMIADMQVKAPGETEPGGPWYQYIVERTSDGALVGDLGVGFGVPGERQVELGYRILPAWQGQGYAREAVTALIDHLAAAHDVHRFVAVAAAPHAASRAVLEALGFRQEGLFAKSFWCNGEWLDDAYYALLAEEWRALRG